MDFVADDGRENERPHRAENVDGRLASIAEDSCDLLGSCGFSFGNGCSGGNSETNLFGTHKRAKTPMEVM